MRTARIIALVGAESTGKTTLPLALRDALESSLRQACDPAAGGDAAGPPGADAPRVTVVAEYLREFCERHERTPARDEQHHIAAEQTRRIEHAAAVSDWVIADTTALMTAVYSEHVFGDPTLYERALRDHARCDLTLLTGLDVAWQPDGLQRDGPQVRVAVDTRLRAALARSALPFGAVYGLGPQRAAAALACVRASLAATASRDTDTPDAHGPTVRWHHHCERCSDSNCERRSRAAR